MCVWLGVWLVGFCLVVLVDFISVFSFFCDALTTVFHGKPLVKTVRLQIAISVLMEIALLDTTQETPCHIYNPLI